MKIKAAAAALIIAALAACSGGGSPTPPAPIPTPVPNSQISLATLNGIPIVATPASPFVEQGFTTATVYVIDAAYSGQVTIAASTVSPATPACVTASIATLTNPSGLQNTLTVALAASCTTPPYRIDITLADPGGQRTVVAFVFD